MQSLDRLVLFRPGPRSVVASVVEATEAYHQGDGSRVAGALRRLLDKAVVYGWQGNLWYCAVAEALATNENPFSLACERRHADHDSLWEIALNDIDVYHELLALELPRAFSVAEEFHHEAPGAPMAEAGARLQRLAREFVRGLVLARAMADNNGSNRILGRLMEYFEERGVGALGLGSLFRVRRAGGRGRGIALAPVEGRRDVRLADLVGYERQKRLLAENTEAFLAGRPANNVLLYGDAGTGKSTSIQALANEYGARGLRIVEVTKGQYPLIPEVLDRVKERNYRFVILLDDLSFEESETEYKSLKSVLEGGGEATPENVLFYATSNRRHLVRETWSDRGDLEHDGDVHRSDTMEEKLSLAGRFGLQIRYPNPTFEEYHVIVRTLARRTDALDHLDDEALRDRAATWQVRRGSRSGRAAQQFVSDLLSRVAEGDDLAEDAAPGAEGDGEPC